MNTLDLACQRIVAALRLWRAGTRRAGSPAPICVALDGASGAGKSTLAACVADVFASALALIPLDDFFSATIPDSAWDTFTVEERLSRVFDWQRVREDVLLPLRAGKPARWHAFDFVAGLQPDGTYHLQPQGVEYNAIERAPAEIILLEGAYSAHPALADLLDYTILVEAPTELRRQRLAAREDPEFLRRWHQRWDPVEDLYFTTIRPPATFDLVIPGLDVKASRKAAKALQTKDAKGLLPVSFETPAGIYRQDSQDYED